MTPCDDYFVEMIIKLSLFRHYVSSSEDLQLINSLIKGTEIEIKAKDWKKYTCVSGMAIVDSLFGTTYWKNFLKRQSYRVVSKKVKI